MRVVVSFDGELLRRYAQRGSSLLFTIFWEHTETCYPNEQWLDFGAVVVVWWLEAALRLAQGAQEERFTFMDGPYSVNAKYDQQTADVELRPEGIDAIWHIKISEFAREIIRAANSIYTEFNRLGIGEEDQASLQFSIARLHAALTKDEK